jgi:hypothetical protein
MKTYSETKGKEAFDWNKFLENPPEYLSNEHDIACNLAADWVTCACGNQCDIIHRVSGGRPFDRKLESLGVNFHYSVKGAEWQKAKEILAKIEKRSSELFAISQN